MITKFLTEVKSVFNPFSVKAKPARLFLAFLPPSARRSMKIETKILPRESVEPSHLYLKFKDGLELNLKPDTLGLQGIFEEVDRHSRILLRKEELGGQ
ncbi:54S ribosomal protein L44, mitochondrial [Erysiphe necator]|uniref:Large ribosomal subunit protein mL53 n=1 Tax=Uncinula necator TaxID=52586 RepID=A0A0B1P8H7_UNCNE|nr:54S ribosomal protein L44, mitochondrial [Erysiphe necator]KHJ34997.1 putative mitochondrial 54s ribosomal protein 44 [Erysiphe necator]